SLATLLLGRYIASLAAQRSERKYLPPERVGGVGDGPETWRIVERIGDLGMGRVRVAGLVLPAASTHLSGCTVPVLGTTQDLASVINRAQIGRIIIVDGRLDQRELEQCDDVAGRMGVTI